MYASTDTRFRLSASQMSLLKQYALGHVETYPIYDNNCWGMF